MQLMSLSSIVAAPFELIIAIAFLYQYAPFPYFPSFFNLTNCSFHRLLGWTCIAGLSVLAISLPVNNLLVTRRIGVRPLVS